MNMPVSNQQNLPTLDLGALLAGKEPPAAEGKEAGMSELHGSYNQAVSGVAGGLGGVLKGVQGQTTEAKTAVQAHCGQAQNAALEHGSQIKTVVQEQGTKAKTALATTAATGTAVAANDTTAKSADGEDGDIGSMFAKLDNLTSTAHADYLKQSADNWKMPSFEMPTATPAEAGTAAAAAGAGAAAAGTAAATGTVTQAPVEAEKAAEPAPAPAPPPPPPKPMASRPSGVPGDPGTVPSPDDKPPEGQNMSVDDYKKCNNGVLGKMGNQEHMMDNLKDRYGDWDDQSRPQADREASAYNAARHVGGIKNKLNGAGEVRTEVSQNGKMEGCTKDGDIRDDTEMADLKNSLKPLTFDRDGKRANTTPEFRAEQQKSTTDVLTKKELRTGHDDHVKGDGTNMDNAEYVGHKILQGLSKILDGIRSLIANTIGKIPGIGKILTAPFEMVSGAISGGLKVADAAVTNNNPKKAAQNMAHDLLSTAGGAISQAGELLNKTVGKIPGLGTAISFVAGVTTDAVSQGLNIADAAAQGASKEDLAKRAKDMGVHIGAHAVNSAISLVDVTGQGGQAAEDAIMKKAGASSTEVDPEAIRAQNKAATSA